MQENKWQVNFDILQTFIELSLDICSKQESDYSIEFFKMLKQIRKLFTFIVPEIQGKSSKVQIPTKYTWYQFINPIKLETKQILGILIIRVSDIDLYISTIDKLANDFEINTYNSKQLDNSELLNLALTCANQAVENSYVFKNFEKIYIRKALHTGDIVLHYAPAKVGLINKDNKYQVELQYSDTQSKLAELVKFSIDRVHKAS